MATFAATYEGSQKFADRDAWQARLRITRDGRPFQFVSVGVSGLALKAANMIEPTDTFMVALGRGAEPRVQDAIISGEVPLPNPREAFDVWIGDARTIRNCATSQEPPLSVGSEIWRFDLADLPSGIYK
jgi:hypothetical protein